MEEILGKLASNLLLVFVWVSIFNRILEKIIGDAFRELESRILEPQESESQKVE